MTQSVSPVWVTYHANGKLEGMQSISTPSYLNTFCQARQQCADKVCARCYAARDMKRKKSLREKLEHNYHVLTERLFTPEECASIPITTLYFRIESFGDVQNLTQAKNYINIAKYHPLSKCGLWTKNIHLYELAIKELGKPDNLSIVLSSEQTNKPTTQKYAFVDHIFTVYDKLHTDDAEINCGGRKCSECGYKCYKREQPFYINELLR